ncbi:glycosyltransferase [Candidatus Uhrbacteria bacterium]|nr:glycosyltransferase [Candidatus Uhrbacteria bacterium]
MKIALVHDHLIQDGGAEHVLRILQEIWPDAPTFTLLHDRERAHPAFLSRDIRLSFIQRLPWAKRLYQWYLPLMPYATERHDLAGYDLVISSASAFAKGVITRPETLHISYCHTPTRYLWSDTHSYIAELNLPAPLKALVPFVLNPIRNWDRLSADRVDRFVANSRNVADRIQKYYRREAEVIYPPVDTKKFSLSPEIDSYYLAGGRLVSYKRFDLLVTAFSRLGIPLKIFGTGPLLGRLREMAKPNIEFLGWVDEAGRAELYRRCIAFLHPQVEDFGLTAVEAMASGRPVIAYNRGGALETIIPGQTGCFIDEQSWEALADTVIRFHPESFNSIRIRDHALSFDTDRFKERMKNYAEEAIKAFQMKQLTLGVKL